MSKKLILDCYHLRKARGTARDETRSFFDFELENGWRVVRAQVSGPVNNDNRKVQYVRNPGRGDTNAKTVVMFYLGPDYAWLDCSVGLCIEGPRGTSPGIPD